MNNMLIQRRYQRRTSFLSVRDVPIPHKIKDSILPPLHEHKNITEIKSAPIQGLSGNMGLNFDSRANSQPLSDVKNPVGSLHRISSFRDLNSVNVIDLPNLPQVDSPMFMKVFIQKIQACRVLCPFADEVKEKESINRKTYYLTEIHRLFLGSSPQSNRLEDEQFVTIYDMCMKNIVRHVPFIDSIVLLNEDVNPLVEPSWPHLNIAYHILFKVLYEFPYAPFFTNETIAQIMKVAHSSDYRERVLISQFLCKFIEFHPVFIEDLIKLFQSMINDHIDLGISPYTVLTILLTFSGILKTAEEVKPSFYIFFKNSVIPLFGNFYFPLYEQVIISILDFFIDYDSKNSSIVVNSILRKWPMTRLVKQASFLVILTKCIPKMYQKDLRPILPRIFSIFAKSSGSECAKVAESAFGLWTTIGFERIINENARMVYNLFYPYVMYSRRNHWSPSVRENATFAVTIMNKIEPKKNLTSREDMDSSINSDHAELKSWVTIARNAALNDGSINLSKTLLEVNTTYANPMKTYIQPTTNIPRRPRSNSIHTSVFT